MTRPFQIEISESQQELEKALKHATTASSKERLQMLYWLKSGQVNSRQAVAELLGRNQATITRVKEIQRWGCSGLLEVKHAPGQAPLVTGKPERLKQRLQDPQGFHSYGQIQQWRHRTKTEYRLQNGLSTRSLSAQCQAKSSSSSKP